MLYNAAKALLFLALSHSPGVEPAGSSPAGSGISMTPDALMHYSYCISSAKDRNAVIDLERFVLYRCHGDIAISYYNYLGRMHARETIAREDVGLFTYRFITGIGRCWYKTQDAAGLPVSEYGCDVYVEI